MTVLIKFYIQSPAGLNSRILTLVMRVFNGMNHNENDSFAAQTTIHKDCGQTPGIQVVRLDNHDYKRTRRIQVSLGEDRHISARCQPKARLLRLWPQSSVPREAHISRS